MKTVALLVIYVGYSLVVYGVDHIEGNCTPFRCCILGQFGGGVCKTNPGSIACTGASNVTPPTTLPGAPPPPTVPATPQTKKQTQPSKQLNPNPLKTLTPAPPSVVGGVKPLIPLDDY